MWVCFVLMKRWLEAVTALLRFFSLVRVGGVVIFSTKQTLRTYTASQIYVKLNACFGDCDIKKNVMFFSFNFLINNN